MKSASDDPVACSVSVSCSRWRWKPLKMKKHAIPVSDKPFSLSRFLAGTPNLDSNCHDPNHIALQRYCTADYWSPISTLATTACAEIKTARGCTPHTTCPRFVCPAAFVRGTFSAKAPEVRRPASFRDRSHSSYMLQMISHP